jgi:uncharacterized Fe-S cluster-containing radical SAM superfamily protein
MIDTERFSEHLRARGVDHASKRVLLTRFFGTEQEQDLSEPPNCDGFGRIRHFKRSRFVGWPDNPLPIDPAARFLGLGRVDEIEAQVFQNAICNWRCWYCFVPFTLLKADPAHSAFLSADEMIELYLNDERRPAVIDLTGGQPDLVPEWVVWTMKAIQDRGLEGQIYLWSDDNLSNDYLWRYLNAEARERLSSFRGYGRVCCFKGYDQDSFAFNTAAAPALFETQFELMGHLMSLGLDIYGYATFTTPSTTELAAKMTRFVDRLQGLHPNLPLRVVPLRIEVFTPVRSRMRERHEGAIQNQYAAIEAWNEELDKRFTPAERATDVIDISLS